MAEHLVVLVGTTKGAFLYHTDTQRQDWQLTGPHLGGWDIYSLLGDSRHGNHIYAGTSHYVYGPTIRVSTDFGETWTQVEGSPSYSAESTFKMKRIWQIVPGHPSTPDRLYAGVEEAGLFVSEDRGETWSELSGLTSHPSRPYWEPGNGGLCLHTILIDPNNARRMWIAISAVGVFRTTDGGETWKVCNNGLPEVPTPQPGSEVGRCVHKVVLDPNNSDTLYMQFHGGVFRSRDGADSWQPIETGLPGNFGFPLVVTPDGNLFLVPLISDGQRYVKDGDLAVYRSQDDGESWEPTREGVPPQQYVGVLRDAMTVDALEPAGVYFGTNMGEVYCSRDSGAHWERLPGQFPRITMLKTWMVTD